MTTAIKSVSVSLEFVKLAEEYKISLTEAVRVGLSVILAERGHPQYLNRTNTGRIIEGMATKLHDYQKKLEEANNVILEEKQ